MAKNFAGFDSAVYPGDSKMQSLFDQTNLYWCGFYLGPRFKWSPHFSKIKGMGWGVAPIYTGKQANSQKLQAIKLHYARQTDALRDALYANGKADGVEAVQRAAGGGAWAVVSCGPVGGLTRGLSAGRAQRASMTR